MLEQETSDIVNEKEQSSEKEKSKKGGAFWTVLAGTGIMFVESIIDFFARDFWAEIEVLGIQISADTIGVFAVIGIVISILLMIFVLLAINKSYYYIVILIISVLAFLISYAFYGPVIVFIGSIIGIAKKNN